VLVAGLLAFKFVVLGALVLAGLLIWVVFRLASRTVGAVSGRAFSRHRPQQYLVPPLRPVCRYDNVRPVVQYVSAAPQPPIPVSSRRRRSSSWPIWVVVGLVAAFVVLGVRSRGRSSVEYRYNPATVDKPRTVQAAERPKKRANKSTPPTAAAPAVLVAERAVRPTNPNWTVTGHGETVDDAKEDACAKAWDQINSYLREQNPPIEWTPSRDFVRKHLARNWGAEVPIEIDELGTVIQIPLHLELTPADRQLIARHEHDYRVEQRHEGLAKILVGLVALFAAIAGYVRLDEWSKGYYTGILRFAAAAFVLASAAGMWFLVRQ
jgi:hypothetical protein